MSKAGASRHWPRSMCRNPWLRKWSSTLVIRIEKAIRRHNSSMSACTCDPCIRITSAIFGVCVFGRIPRVGPEHCSGRDIHQPPAAYGTIKAADKRHRRTIAVDQARFGRIDSGRGSELQCHHFPLGNSALVSYTWKLSNRQAPLVIDNCAFRSKAAQRRASTAQVSEVGSSLAVRLNRLGGGQQLRQFDQWWRRPSALLGCSLGAHHSRHEGELRQPG